jgi:hypothetical protein
MKIGFEEGVVLVVMVAAVFALATACSVEAPTGATGCVSEGAGTGERCWRWKMTRLLLLAKRGPRVVAAACCMVLLKETVCVSWDCEK